MSNMSDGCEVAVLDVSDGQLFGRGIAACRWCREPSAFSVLVGLAVVDRDDGSTAELSTVSCQRCAAQGPMAEGGALPALAAWNAPFFRVRP